MLKMLPRDGLARLVAVILGPNSILLLDRPRIPCTRVLPLVVRQKRWRRSRPAIPPIPPAPVCLPVSAPVVAPARWRIEIPADEVTRRPAVIAHRNAQHIHRHVLGLYLFPRPVVPTADIPVVLIVDPIEAIVKEVIPIGLRRIVDGIARHPDESRVDRHVDANVDARKIDIDTDLSMN